MAYLAATVSLLLHFTLLFFSSSSSSVSSFSLSLLLSFFYIYHFLCPLFRFIATPENVSQTFRQLPHLPAGSAPPPGISENWRPIPANLSADSDRFESCFDFDWAGGGENLRVPSASLH